MKKIKFLSLAIVSSLLVLTACNTDEGKETPTEETEIEEVVEETGVDGDGEGSDDGKDSHAERSDSYDYSYDEILHEDLPFSMAMPTEFPFNPEEIHVHEHQQVEGFDEQPPSADILVSGDGIIISGTIFSEVNLADIQGENREEFTTEGGITAVYFTTETSESVIWTMGDLSYTLNKPLMEEMDTYDMEGFGAIIDSYEFFEVEPKEADGEDADTSTDVDGADAEETDAE